MLARTKKGRYACERSGPEWGDTTGEKAGNAVAPDTRVEKILVAEVDKG